MSKIFGQQGALYALAALFLIGLPLADGDVYPAFGRTVVGAVITYGMLSFGWNLKKFLAERRSWGPPQQPPHRKTR